MLVVSLNPDWLESHPFRTNASMGLFFAGDVLALLEMKAAADKGIEKVREAVFQSTWVKINVSFRVRRYFRVPKTDGKARPLAPLALIPFDHPLPALSFETISFTRLVLS